MGIACKLISIVSYPENEGKEMVVRIVPSWSRDVGREHDSHCVGESCLLVLDQVRSLSRHSHPWSPKEWFEVISCRQT